MGLFNFLYTWRDYSSCIPFFRYPLEMHIVHTRANFAADVGMAVDPENCNANGAYCGLAVVGILFHVGSENNTVLDVSHISLKTWYSWIITSHESTFSYSHL